VKSNGMPQSAGLVRLCTHHGDTPPKRQRFPTPNQGPLSLVRVAVP